MAAHICAKSDYNDYGPAERHRHLLQILHSLHDIVFCESLRPVIDQVIIAQIRLCTF